MAVTATAPGFAEIEESVSVTVPQAGELLVITLHHTITVSIESNADIGTIL